MLNTRSVSEAPGAPAMSDNGRNHILFLDGVRGFAALVVYMSHAGEKGMYLPGEFTTGGIGKGGVYLFFVLSAYLITTILLRGREKLSQPTYLARFFSRRFLRVYPLFFLYVLCALISTPLAQRIFGHTEFAVPFPLDFMGALEHFALLRGDGVSWSIPVEMKYYLVSPIIAAALIFAGRRFGIGLTLVLATPIILLASWAIGGLDFIETPTDKSADLITYLPAFLIGAVLAFYRHETDKLSAASSRSLSQNALGWLAALGLIAMTPSIYAWLTQTEILLSRFYDSVLLYSVLWALVINAIFSGNAILRWFFTLSHLRFLGLVSFSFYLSHPVFLELSVRGIGPYSHIAAILVGYFATLAFSYGTYRLIEKPILEGGTQRVDQWLERRRAIEPR